MMTTPLTVQSIIHADPRPSQSSPDNLAKPLISQCCNSTFCLLLLKNSLSWWHVAICRTVHSLCWLVRCIETQHCHCFSKDYLMLQNSLTLMCTLPRARATAKNGIWSMTVLLLTGPLWVSLGLFHTTLLTPDFLMTLEERCQWSVWDLIIV